MYGKSRQKTVRQKWGKAEKEKKINCTVVYIDD